MILYAKNERNKLLQESDKYVLIDYPITSQNLILIKEYRQNLRDYFQLPDVVSFINDANIKLPDLPQFPDLL
jgi:hypothetical protein